MTRRGPGPSLSIRPVTQSELSARFMIVSDLQAGELDLQRAAIDVLAPFDRNKSHSKEKRAQIEGGGGEMRLRSG